MNVASCSDNAVTAVDMIAVLCTYNTLLGVIIFHTHHSLDTEHCANSIKKSIAFNYSNQTTSATLAYFAHTWELSCRQFCSFLFWQSAGPKRNNQAQRVYPRTHV